MRCAALAGFVLAALPATGLAQSLPYRAVVSDPEITLRAGPSDKFPETGTLPKGTALVVHEDAGNGWVAVQAPRSVSWVPIQMVDFDPSKKTPQDVTTQDEVTLAPGKIGLAQPLAEVRRITVPAGTILTVVGEKAAFDGKSWYPVMTIAGDYRYLPKSAVSPAGPANTSFVVRDAAPPGLPPVGPPPPGGGVLPPAAAGAEAATKAASNHPLWAQAEAAEKDSRFDDAERLYFQLARQMNEPGGDHDLANLCYTRIHAIRERKRNVNAGALPPPASVPGPGRAADPPRPDRATLLPPLRADGKAGPPAPTTTPAPAPTAGDPLPPAADGTARWSGVGTLTRSALALDGRRTYALESAPGIVRVYVVSGAGVDLERYANRRVNLYGTTHTRRDLSKPYLLVTDVDPNP
ncbi:MAG TPA: SH3 domain-containing protein [Urbifossiella sp.]|nr:SH3 domain-containing protein [Urbifossiella sp.]